MSLFQGLTRGPWAGNGVLFRAVSSVLCRGSTVFDIVMVCVYQINCRSHNMPQEYYTQELDVTDGPECVTPGSHII